jgi:hypothetical protein
MSVLIHHLTDDLDVVGDTVGNGAKPRAAQERSYMCLDLIIRPFTNK